jgi:hypothetical protein
VQPPLAGQAVAVSATEGMALASTAVATFTDANTGDAASAFISSINWGDGATSTGTVTGAAGSFTVTGGRTYSDEGSFPLSVTVTRTGDGTTVMLGGASASVAEGDVLTAASLSTIVATLNLPVGLVANFTDSNAANMRRRAHSRSP